MNIVMRQFLGENHSWSVVGWGIAQSLINKNQNVDLFSTDGIKNIPLPLKKNIIGFSGENSLKMNGKIPDTNYDLAISYTAMINFSSYLSHGKKKIGIWCYEWAGKNVLPNGFAKNYKYCDILAAPSQFSKQVFIDSGVPESKIKVIPHGVDNSFFNGTSTIALPTKKKYKILANIAQNHLRKNIPGLLDVYGKAFAKEDDVCLILKAKDKKITFPFEVSLNDCFNKFYEKYKNHAEIKVISEFIPDMSALYRSVDAFFTLPFCEGFLVPGLESIASGKLVIAPNWGGQVDFLNDSNSLLVSGKEVRANPRSMYWESKNNAIWFEPDIDDAVDKLKYAYQNFNALNAKVELQRNDIYNKYNWDSITEQLLNC